MSGDWFLKHNMSGDRFLIRLTMFYLFAGSGNIMFPSLSVIFAKKKSIARWSTGRFASTLITQFGKYRSNLTSIYDLIEIQRAAITNMQHRVDTIQRTQLSKYPFIVRHFAQYNAIDIDGSLRYWFCLFDFGQHGDNAVLVKPRSNLWKMQPCTHDTAGFSGYTKHSLRRIWGKVAFAEHSKADINTWWAEYVGGSLQLGSRS